MNIENPMGNTPDTSSTGQGGGQGAVSTPASTPSNVSGQGSQSVDYSKELAEYKTSYQHAQSKINEQGNKIAELSQQLEQFSKSSEEQKQRMAQALGLVPEQTASSFADKLYTDPEAAIREAIARETERIEQEKIAPLQQKLEEEAASKMIAHNISVRDRLQNELSQRYDSKVVDSIFDTVGQMIASRDPEIARINQALSSGQVSGSDAYKLNTALNQRIAKVIAESGGYENLTYLALGQFSVQNFDTLMQSGAQVHKMKTIRNNRLFSPGGYTGSAPIQNQGQSSNGYSSTSYFK